MIEEDAACSLQMTLGRLNEIGKCVKVPEKKEMVLRTDKVPEKKEIMLRTDKVPEKKEMVLRTDKVPEKKEMVLRTDKVPEKKEIMLRTDKVPEKKEMVLRTDKVPEKKEIMLRTDKVPEKKEMVLRTDKVPEKKEMVLRTDKVPEKKEMVLRTDKVPEKKEIMLRTDKVPEKKEMVLRTDKVPEKKEIMLRTDKVPEKKEMVLRTDKVPEKKEMVLRTDKVPEKKEIMLRTDKVPEKKEMVLRTDKVPEKKEMVLRTDKVPEKKEIMLRTDKVPEKKEMVLRTDKVPEKKEMVLRTDKVPEKKEIMLRTDKVPEKKEMVLRTDKVPEKKEIMLRTDKVPEKKEMVLRTDKVPEKKEMVLRTDKVPEKKEMVLRTDKVPEKKEMVLRTDKVPEKKEIMLRTDKVPEKKEMVLRTDKVPEKKEMVLRTDKVPEKKEIMLRTDKVPEKKEMVLRTDKVPEKKEIMLRTDKVPEKKEMVLRTDKVPEKKEMVLRTDKVPEKKEMVLRTDKVPEKKEMVLRTDKVPEKKEMVLRTDKVPEKKEMVLRTDKVPEKKEIMLRTDKVPEKNEMVLRTDKVPEKKEIVLRTDKVPEKKEMVLRTDKVPEKKEMVLRTDKVPEKKEMVLRTDKVPEKKEMVLRTDKVPEKKEMVLRTDKVPKKKEMVLRTGKVPEKMDKEKNNHIDRDKDNNCFCHLCNITIPLIHNITEHLRGFRHRKFQATLDSVIKNSGSESSHDDVRYENINKNGDSTYVCIVCDKQLLSFIDTERHLIGKTHMRNLALKSTLTFPWDKIKELECGNRDNIQKVSSDKFRCKLCNKTLDLKSILSHVGGSTHQLALGLKEMRKINKLDPLISHQIWHEIFTAECGKWSNITQVSLECFKCFPCSQVLSLDDIAPHVKSDTHKSQISCCENVKRNEVLQNYFLELWKNMSAPENTHEIYFKIENDTSLYCIPCNANLPGTVANLMDHIHGRSHMGIIFKHLMSSSDVVPEEKDVPSAQEALVKALLPREEFHCIVCNTRVELESDWQLHLDSHRHMRAVDMLLEADVELVTQQCAVCDATVFCVKNDVNKHDCQMRLSRRVNGSESSSSKTPRIRISGYPTDAGIDTLYSCFKDFGKITCIAMTRESAVIEFLDKSVMEYALAHPPSVGEIKLKVDGLKYYNHRALTLTETIHVDIVSALESAQRFELKQEELCNLTSGVSSPQSSHDMCRFLETELSCLFPNCRAFPFGSRVSGLAFPESDMDIFLDTGDMYDGKQRQESEVQELIVSVTESALRELPQCSKVEGVPKARTPIVRFFLNSTRTQCDVAFRHGLGVENTRLIRFYMSLDKRIKPLIVFVKHWAKAHELIGPTKITNYALTWLAIFYLQQASGFGLPSVESLQRLHAGREHRIAGWTCSFCNDKTAVKTIKQTKSVLHLLHGFFVYYYKFDYSRNVICPLVGVPIKKHLFVGDKIHKLPESMASYVHNVSEHRHAEKLRTTSLCVQDPFDLSHNITKGTPPAILNKYKTVCMLSDELCSRINNYVL